LSYEDLTTTLQSDLLAAGYDATHYKGHSFRIEAATTMAFNGVPDHVIKDKGGWSSDTKAFCLYVGKAPQEVLIHMSSFLARTFVPDPVWSIRLFIYICVEKHATAWPHGTYGSTASPSPATAR
jgi:hypothetical protein